MGLRHLPGIAFDLRRRRRARGGELEALQKERLSRMVAFARERSPFYRDLYQRLPPSVTDVRMLAPASKGDLMERFEEWVTDPAVKLRDVEAFVSDPLRIGSLFLDRYVVFATSGTTGRPAVFLSDAGAARVYAALAAMRRLPSLFSFRGLRSFP